MKGILLLGTALLLAAPALAGTSNETAASMTHINIEDPLNPIYDAPSTPTSGASGNANFVCYRLGRSPADGYCGPDGYRSMEPVPTAYDSYGNPVYDAPPNY